MSSAAMTLWQNRSYSKGSPHARQIAVYLTFSGGATVTQGHSVPKQALAPTSHKKAHTEAQQDCEAVAAALQAFEGGVKSFNAQRCQC